jgi:cell wall-associated NlpC family hydrolase
MRFLHNSNPVRGTATLGTRAGLGIAALFLVGALSACGQGSTAVVEAPAKPRPHSRIAEEQPPHPSHLDVATPTQEAAARRAAAEATARREAAAAAKKERKAQEAEPEPAPEPSSPPPPGSLPPASAGTNGSYTPPPPSQRKEITPRVIERLERQEAEGRAVLLSGIALAPPGAPERIKAAISAANTIVGRPYIWGGGHASWYSTGYDCSGAVSFMLGGGGFLEAPLDSTRLESWGAPGPGKWITVYANAGHAYAVIAGLRWDTVGDENGTGPRWHAAAPYPEGFVARHPPGF